LSAKVNHQLTPRQSLMARFAVTNARESADAFNAGGLVDVSARGTNGTRDAALTGVWTSVLGTRSTNDLRAQVAARRVALRTTDQRGPGVLISGVAEFGRPYVGNNHHAQRYVEVGDTFARTQGRHFIKTGFDVTRVSVTGINNDGFGGVYLFRSLDAFLNQQPESYRQRFGDPAVEMVVSRPSAFVQDHWTPFSTLTADIGIRFDAERLPERLNITNRQFSPRFGIAWSLASNWLVRAGAGRFADRLPLVMFERALVLDGRHGFEQIISDPTSLELCASLPCADIRPSIYTVRPDAWTPFSAQMSVGIERQLTADMTASLTYLRIDGRHLARTVNVNLPPPTVLSPVNAATLGVVSPLPQQMGRPVFGLRRLDAVYTDVFELQPTASSKYNGLTFALNRRLAHELEWSASYTWSHAIDTASDFDEQPQNPYAPTEERADSRYDQRHRFVASALFDVPIGEVEDRKPGDPAPGKWVRAFSDIEIAPIVTIGSGHSLNALTGGDDNRTHAFPLIDRPRGLTRNSLRLPATSTVDVRVLKFFDIKPHGKLDLVFEMFNVFNRLNVTELNPTFGPFADALSNFRRPIDAQLARQFQFSIDFEF
jgi:hypothetical protein